MNQLVIESLLLLTNTNAGKIVLKNQGFAALINCIDNAQSLKVLNLP